MLNYGGVAQSVREPGPVVPGGHGFKSHPRHFRQHEGNNVRELYIIERMQQFAKATDLCITIADPNNAHVQLRLWPNGNTDVVCSNSIVGTIMSNIGDVLPVLARLQYLCMTNKTVDEVLARKAQEGPQQPR